jgi:3-oxoadipate enol-lactonase
MPQARINAVDLYYESTGNGPPVLFIHGGFGGVSTTLSPRTHPWATAILDTYRFIHYDRRAAGRSGYPDAGYTLENFAADARGLLEHLGEERAFIMGDSAGGPIALTFALAYPDATRGLVLAETGARLLTGRFAERIRERLAVLETAGAASAYAARKAGGGVGLDERAKWFTLPPDIEEELARGQQAFLERLAQTTREDRIGWYAGELRNYSAYLDVDLHPRLAEIRCPTLVIHGDRDGLIPFELGQRLAAGLPNAELVTIADADHGVMFFPGAAQALRGWLDRQRRSAS